MGTKVLPELIVEEYSNVICYKQNVSCQRDSYINNPDVNVWHAIKHPSKLFNLLDIYTVNAIGEMFIVRFAVAGNFSVTKEDRLYLSLNDDMTHTFTFESGTFKTKYYSSDNFTVVDAIINLSYNSNEAVQYLIDIKNAIEEKDNIDVTVEFYHDKLFTENTKILPSYYRELHNSEQYTKVINSYKED